MIAQQKTGAGMRYGGMLLFAETQDTVTLHSNTLFGHQNRYRRYKLPVFADKSVHFLYLPFPEQVL